MLKRLSDLYFHITLDTPVYGWILTFLLLAGSLFYVPNFDLDASSDSLMLENDADLQYYRTLRGSYGSDDFVLVTFTPKGDLFSDATLGTLKKMHDELAAMEHVSGVTSILDVPMLQSPPVGLSDVLEGTRTLLDKGTDREMARKEFSQSPLYRSLLTSPDGKTTGMMVNFRPDPRMVELRKEQDALYAIELQRPLQADERAKLTQLSAEVKQINDLLRDQMQNDIAEVRSIIARYRDAGELHLGGVPMITSDMIDFVRSDINVFGAGISLFIVALLAISFKRLRWVLVPLFICGVSVVVMVGFLGVMEWRVTVVSSNFISLLLIISLSLTIHLVVRHQELHAQHPDGEQGWFLREALASKAAPSLFTTLTTMVAFGSLLVSGIRPVIDFGWMMFYGVGFTLLLAFLLFPIALTHLKPGKPILRKHDATAVFTRSLANFIERHSSRTLIAYVLIALLGIFGISRLTVENRFIDYFKPTTEIYQGMVLIDKQLGGTTPLDVVLDPPKAWLDMKAQEAAAAAAAPKEDSFFDSLFSDQSEGDAGITASSYWFNDERLKQVRAVHDYLDALPSTGKVLSMATTMDVLTLINDGEQPDDFTLAIMYKRIPEAVKATLFTPYMTEDGNQVRFSIRIIDSDPTLRRDELLKKIESDLVQNLGLKPEQVHLSGMLVLYNNVLQSLFTSQILTLSLVFLAILVMLIMLFRSLSLAAVGVVPTVFAALFILGVMGLVGIPLDIMTITIAAIVIGIGVDNSIHYIHRVREEFELDGKYWAAVERTHASVGRAMAYTSFTITLGFSILALSNFIPTIYFGLLTSLAMVVALVANLTLLPLLVVKFRPLGAEREVG